MDRYLENVIEITQVYDALIKSGKIDDDVDSLTYKEFICDWAAEFETLNRNVEWGNVGEDGVERDYYIEIEKFAEDKLLKNFGVDGNEYEDMTFIDTEIGQLYMLSGENAVTKYVEIGIGVKDKVFLPIYAIEVMKEGAECIDLYEGEYNSDGEYEGLDLVKEVDLEELNDRALKMLEKLEETA